MPKLIVSIDGVVIKEVTLAKDRTTLGRRPYNDIVVDNLAISGEHAVLHMIGGDVYLEDLNSTNGTYVNGRAIKKQALSVNGITKLPALMNAVNGNFQTDLTVDDMTAIYRATQAG